MEEKLRSRDSCRWRQLVASEHDALVQVEETMNRTDDAALWTSIVIVVALFVYAWTYGPQ